jgi:hypothetical protein
LRRGVGSPAAKNGGGSRTSPHSPAGEGAVDWPQYHRAGSAPCKPLKEWAGTADLHCMALNEPATENWSEPEWNGSATPVPVLVKDVPAAGRALPGFGTVARWTLLVCAGLAVWTGAIYGLLRLLADPLS